MPDFKIEPTTPLDGFSQDFDELSLAEIQGLAIISVAASAAGRDALEKALKSAYSLPLTSGQEAATSQGVSIFSTAPDQWFLTFDRGSDLTPAKTVAQILGDGFAITDQSDSYAVLALQGALSRTVLERICPLDLSDQAFPSGSAARTHMEHMGVILHRGDGADHFVLMTSRSMAGSFLHAVETSIKNVI